MDIQEKFREQLAKEKQMERAAQERMKGEFYGAIQNDRIFSVVSNCLSDLVTKSVEKATEEEVSKERAVAEHARLDLQEQLNAEREKSASMQNRISELAKTIEERERMEGQEWADMLDDNYLDTDGQDNSKELPTQENAGIGMPVIANFK